jgi:HK97 family phage prohead protease
MNDVYRIKSFDFPVKDVDMNSRTIVQAYTKYDVVDSDNDRGRKGMFNKTWGENFSRIKHLLNHDTTKPLGKVEKMWDDNEYAYGQSKIGTHSLGEDFIKMADSGLITEASYGYKVIKEQKLKDGTNELLEVKMWEWSSLTAWGANQYTPIISLTKDLTKAEQEDKIASRIKALERFCKTTTATDETIQLLLLELKQLQQLFIDNQKATEPDVTTQPETKDDELLSALKQYANNLKSSNSGTERIDPNPGQHQS